MRHDTACALPNTLLTFCNNQIKQSAPADTKASLPTLLCREGPSGAEAARLLGAGERRSAMAAMLRTAAPALGADFAPRMEHCRARTHRKPPFSITSLRGVRS